jgi:hypothetical protein
MAKPIKSTPELTGEEADKFLKKMIKVEESRITQSQKDFAQEIERNMSALLIC